MKALFLVGGQGTRLRPLTDRLPKPMVPVMGRPLLERNLERLKLHGISEIVLSTCYKPEVIERYFGNGSDFGLHIHYVSEDFPLGTGGAIKNCEQYFDDTFFVFNADILSNINFSEMLRYHKRKRADVTIAVTRVNNPSAYGVVEYDEKGYASSFREKPAPHEVVSHFINAGVQYNGFKVQYGGRTLYGPELQQIKELMKKGIFEHGVGQYSFRSPVADYSRMIAQKIHLGNRKLKVAVDAGNGTAGLFVLPILESLGCQVVPLYCDSDPLFPHYFPDPIKVENMQDLIKAVKKNNADLGLGFDGDGDRLGVVDETGEIIWGDRMMVLFWREILPRYPGANAIVEVKCSDQLVDEIKKLGGKPMFYKTGHSLIKAKMKELNAIFTGEMSGHMFFADEYYGYDDAIYAAARLLRILSNTSKSLHTLLSDLPKTYATPEIRVKCEENEKAAYVEKARTELRKFALGTVEVDGIRARFNDGWGLVRASNTGPELIVRCEGKDKEACERIRQVIAKALYPLKIAV